MRLHEALGAPKDPVAAVWGRQVVDSCESPAKNRRKDVAHEAQFPHTRKLLQPKASWSQDVT